MPERPAERCSVFQALLDSFEWFDVSPRPVVRPSALTLMAQYNLGSHDAAHVASATVAGRAELASFDTRHRRGDGLFLWNDQIDGI